jgi:hypothetical protein
MNPTGPITWFLLGQDPRGELVAVERSRFGHHASICGIPGSAKSMTFLSLLRQSLLHPDGPHLLVYIDMKAVGDPVVRNWLANNVPDGWDFVYFSLNEKEKSATYNPLASITSHLTTPAARTDALCGQLGIGKASSRDTFFIHNNVALCLQTFQKHPDPKTFEELRANLEAVRDANDPRYKYSTDIIYRGRMLVCPRLTDQPGKWALIVPSLFDKPTILCVSLPVMEGTTLPQYLAKFLLSDIVLSANGRRTLLFCDEAQHLFDNRETLLVAEQARGCGVGILMASQSRDQYQTEDGKPLGWIVDKLCRVKVQFSPNSPDDLKRIMVLSGLKDITRKCHTITNRPTYSWFDSTSESFTDSDGKEYNLTLNDILDHLKKPMNFVLQVDHDERYSTPTLVHGAWPLTKEDYLRLAKWQWPTPSVPPPTPPTPNAHPAPTQNQPKQKSKTLRACEQAATKPPKKKPKRKKKN